jgi:hypothetical protein
MSFIRRHITLYRPTFVSGFIPSVHGGWEVCYGTGPLRARLFGIRIPVRWAI